MNATTLHAWSVVTSWGLRAAEFLASWDPLPVWSPCRRGAQGGSGAKPSQSWQVVSSRPCSGVGGGRRITFCGGASLSGGHQSLAQSGKGESQALEPRLWSFLAASPLPSSGAEEDRIHECIGRGRSSLVFPCSRQRRRGGSQSRVFFLFVCVRERDVASGPESATSRVGNFSPSPNFSFSPKGTSQGFILGDSSTE